MSAWWGPLDGPRPGEAEGLRAQLAALQAQIRLREEQLSLLPCEEGSD